MSLYPRGNWLDNLYVYLQKYITPLLLFGGRKKFYFLLFFFLSGCGGTICKWKEKKIVLNYDSFKGAVTVGGKSYAKHNPPFNIASWIKKVIVEDDGFLVVNEQKTAGFKKRPCDHDKTKMCDKHVISSYFIMQYYRDDEGYKYWRPIPKKKWASISSLNDKMPENPNFHATECEFSFFGGALNDLLVFFRAW